MYYNIVYILGRHTSGKAVQEAQREMPFQEFAIQLHLFWQNDLDKQNPDNPKSDWQIIDKANFIFLASHGSIIFFKKCNFFWERYKGKKKVYFQSGIDEEFITFFDKCGITRKEYGGIYRYFEAKKTAPPQNQKTLESRQQNPLGENPQPLAQQEENAAHTNGQTAKSLPNESPKKRITIKRMKNGLKLETWKSPLIFYKINRNGSRKKKSQVNV